MTDFSKTFHYKQSIHEADCCKSCYDVQKYWCKMFNLMSMLRVVNGQLLTEKDILNSDGFIGNIYIRVDSILT